MITTETQRSGATTKYQYHHGDTETRRKPFRKKAKATAKTTEDKREKFSNE
jgi:hypothetical protein